MASHAVLKIANPDECIDVNVPIPSGATYDEIFDKLKNAAFNYSRANARIKSIYFYEEENHENA